MTAGVTLARAQGLFNVVGGLWPIVSLRSFEAVFGPKSDVPVQMASGGLFLTTGIALLTAPATEAGIEHARRVGVAAAATYLVIDLIYVPKRELRPTYLLDAAMELGWLYAWWRTRRRRPDDVQSAAHTQQVDVTT